MKLIAKSSCDINQLTDRMDKNLIDIEIQLMEDFFDQNNDISKYTHIMSGGWDIRHIHAPFIPGGADLPVEYVGDSSVAAVFLKMCKLAQMCAEYYNHDVIVVVHTGTPLSVLLHMPEALIAIEEVVGLALTNYPNIIFSIENGALYSVKHESIHISKCALFENVELAKYFNRRFQTNRFGTTIDICHILMSIKVVNMVGVDPWAQSSIAAIDRFFRQNQDVLNNIHLNNIKNLGLSHDHGQTFKQRSRKDMELLHNILDIYKKYECLCDITMEISEKDYTNAVNVKKLKKAVEKYMSSC